MFSVLVILVIMLTGGSVFLIIRKQKSIYGYDVERSYRFQEQMFNTERIDVKLIDDVVEVPAAVAAVDTALLKIAVKTVGRGEPSIEMVQGEIRKEQVFERGASGIRYLNISPLLREMVDNKIHLVVKGLEITSQTAELILFKNELPDNPKIMVVAPHPDDAEIAAYGLYSNYKDTHIITVAAGDGGPRNFSRLYTDMAEHYLKKGQLRTWNSITVPMLCGIPSEQAVNLGHFDGTFKTMFENKERVVPGVYTGISDINTYRKMNVSSLASELKGTSSWVSLVENLETMVNRIQPDIILTPHPLLDSQEDHKYVSLALFEAIRNTGRQEGSLMFYANHYAFNEYFPYGEQGSVVSLPPNFSDKPFFTSVYSHSLSYEVQRDKMFSMEAMHDLRLNTDRHFSKDATSAAIKGPLKERLGLDDSYYRRAVRCNELFFTAAVKDLFDEAAYAQLSLTE